MNNMQTIKGSDHEISFWKQFVQSDRFINGWLPDRKTPELNDLVYMFLLGQPEAKVLDCGSGVVSILHGTVSSENLTAYDPLGGHYEGIFNYKEFGFTPPWSIAAEYIVDVDKFDIVHISNALDHCQQPNVAFDRLYRAVKPGGFLIVQGFVNEGTHEEWQGFHNWNLDIDFDSLLITGKTTPPIILDANPYFACKIYLDVLGRDWLIYITRKPLEA